MATPNGSKNLQAEHDMAADGYMGDKDNLIENGITVTKESTPESPNSYGEVAPLQLTPPSPNVALLVTDGYNTRETPILEAAANDLKNLSLDPKQERNGLKMIIISCVVFALGVTVALIVTIYCAPPQVTPHGAVACDDERCSNIGVDVMKKGGSTIDAAISVMFCLSVVQAESSGIGGGGFMVYRNHRQKKTTAYNFRESAPQNVDAAILEQDDETKNRGSFVGVPGYLKGLAAAYKDHGSSKWPSLIQPSIDLARQGFNVSKTMAYKLKEFIDCQVDDENVVKTYCKDDGTVYKEGEEIKLESYATLLERVASEGADILYSGELAQEILDTVNAAGAQMTMDDMTSYNVVEEEPIVTTFQNMTVETIDAPGGGPLLLFALNVLERYGPKPSDANSSLYFHRFIETMKFANALYDYLGDPAVNAAVKGHVSKIIDPNYAKSIVLKINDTTTREDQYYVDASGLFKGQGQTQRRATHTTHVSVIGPNDDHVAITCSMNNNFGSKLMTASGILLNDQLTDFSNINTSNNYFRPGGKPLSHIAPTIVHSRDKPCGLRLATGGVGGWSITSEITQSLVNILSFNMNVKDSIETPGIKYTKLNEADFVAEEGFSPSLFNELITKMGHTTLTTLAHTEDHTVVNTVMKVNETVSAHADDHREGGEVVF